MEHNEKFHNFSLCYVLMHYVSLCSILETDNYDEKYIADARSMR